MSRTSLPNEEEFVAELRLQLDAPRVPLDQVLDGALALSALGYRALSAQYADRVCRYAAIRGRPDLLPVARGLLLGGGTGRRVARA
ncbi:MAG: hypothetical protein HY904_19615 [Deltaproteobacteria bacterium]|nr:hypothetical protein [Deltaproteobacteria bacterium]